MSPAEVDAASFSPDILEFIRLLHAHQVRYVVVGGEAVIYHGHARLTGDIDFFYDSSPDNSAALFEVLKEFWGGQIPGIETVEELREEGVIIQFGRPPNRIDLLNRIDGVTFDQAWPHRATELLRTPAGEFTLHYVGLTELIRNKETCARPKDLEDLKFLRLVRQ
jgi:hypothetical protein